MIKFLFSIFLICLTAAGNSAFAAHAFTLHGEPKYPANFAHFDYVKPDAPKGGQLNLSNLGNFDKLNPFTLKGVTPALLSALLFETLTVSSEDEAASVYGSLANDIDVAKDRLSVTFRLNPAARFSNGDPVTANDVKYSYDTLTSKRAHPVYRQYYADVSRVVVVNAGTVRFEFKRVNRELPLIVGQIPIFSPKWGAGKAFDQIVTDTPVGSGPYIVERYDVGRYLVYKRNPNWWGQNLPTRRGMFNFDRITVRYYKDELARMEAFKAGEFDFLYENSAKNWVRSHKGSQWDRGEIIKKLFEHQNNSGMQGFVYNTRRPQFQDVRVRKALALAMDFEWMNKQIFQNSYIRSYSFFTNSELAATGKPDTAELKLLNPLRSKLDPAVFEEVPQPPVTTPPHSLRDNLRQARELLAAAGWTYRDGALRNAKGEPFVFDMILQTKTFERVAAPFARNLEKLGITMRYRAVDNALYIKRVDSFDFDSVIDWFLTGQSPGNELYSWFHSRSRNEEGSDNRAGVRDPAVDALIEHIVQAETREDLVTACRALDRILRAGWYFTPHFHSRTHRVSYRNKFGIPAALPKYYTAEPWAVRMWWSKQ
ncbi:MAG: ABC transporter substrate-binding protein [Burkholderiales bacterium]|nr:ABC transporter substrate-binding protein [Burkholderiales bacterium]